MISSDPLIRRAATAAILSCVVVALTDIIAWALLVESYSPIRETISALAVGPGSWLLDIGLWIFAAGCVALAFAMFRWHLGARAWRLAAVAIMLLGPVIGVIALFNEYAGKHNAGANVHLAAVCALGLLVAAAALLVVPSLRLHDDRLARRGVIFAGAWVILAPLFFVIPDGWNGGYERLLALMLLGWVATISSFVLR